MKRCSKCREEKAREEFNKNAGKRDGLHNQCRTCHRETSLTWSKNNPIEKRLHKLRHRGMGEEGLTAARKALLKHDGRCGLCGSTASLANGWNVDHDHNT